MGKGSHSERSLLQSRALKYLHQYGEKEFYLESPRGNWEHAVLVPSYGESLCVFRLLHSLKKAATQELVILVVNEKPNSPSWAKENNQWLLKALDISSDFSFIPWGKINLWVINATQNRFGNKDGVGLARKIGGDLAIKLWMENKIHSPWIRTTDADAIVPEDYFLDPLEKAVAFTYPYLHLSPEHFTAQEKKALQLYDQFLKDHEEGLLKAHSPYAFQTIGSTLIFEASSYVTVRGFPKKEAGEDFYFLNKLAKVGSIKKLNRKSILLFGRNKVRVPFGTAKSIFQFTEETQKFPPYCAYPLECYSALKEFLCYAEDFLEGKPGSLLKEKTKETAQKLEAFKMLELAKTSRKNIQQQKKQFHESFDGQKTMLFIRSYFSRYFKEALH